MFTSYRQQDRDTAERLIPEPLVFTSPQGDQCRLATTIARPRH